MSYVSVFTKYTLQNIEHRYNTSGPIATEGEELLLGVTSSYGCPQGVPESDAPKATQWVP